MGYGHWMRHARRRIFVWLVAAITLTLYIGHRIAQHGVHHRPWLVPVVALLVLWFAAHRVAARLAKPLDDLVRMAEQMGQGSFSVRSTLPLRSPLEAHRVALALSGLGERIEQQMSEQRALLASVSHELRSPLARLRLLSELARDEDNEAQRAKHLKNLDAEIEEIDQLVGTLLQGARLDFSGAARVPLDLSVLVTRVCARAGVTYEAESASGPIRVMADPSLLSRAIENLLDNARTHAGGVGAVLLGPANDTHGAEGVRVTVLDNGPGLPEGDPSQIFELFYRKGGATHGGLGLGLTLVERMVRAHGGHVFASTREGGRGAAIGFWLPSI